MELEDALSWLDKEVKDYRGKSLSDLEQQIIRECWEGQVYDKTEILSYSVGYLKTNVAPQLWRLLSDMTRKKVTKKTLRIVLEATIKERLHASDSAIPLVQPPPSAIAANNCGFDCYTNRDLTQAKKQFELAIKINPDHAASYYSLALIYEEIGDFNRAIELYREAASNGFAAAYCNLARLHIIEEKKYDFAVNICRRGLELVEEDTVETDKIVKAALLTYLAWAWTEQGRDEEAIEKLQAAIELEENRALTHALMARALENLGQHTEALEAWKNYVNKYPNCERRDKDIWMAIARQRLKEQSCQSPLNERFL